MTINLDNLNLDELKDLKKRVDKAIDEYEGKRRREALEELEAVAEKMGFTVNELVDPGAGKKRKKLSAKPKYRHKDNHSLTWAGRGRKPKWFEDAAEPIPGTD